LRQRGRTLLCEQESQLWQRFGTPVQHPGQSLWWLNVRFTQRFACPVNLLAYWQPGEKEPWLFATNLATPQLTLTAYQRRVSIEEMLADFKQHGFDLESIINPCQDHEMANISNKQTI